MVRFHALAAWEAPELHLWRPNGAGFNLPSRGRDDRGFHLFLAEEGDLDHQIHGDVFFKLHAGADWEEEAFNRSLPRLAEYRFPTDVWLAHGTRRVLLEDPLAAFQENVVVHLITGNLKYLEGTLYLWTPGNPGRTLKPIDKDKHGVYFLVPLTGLEKHLFAFKLADQDGNYEPNQANRLWCAQDGGEVWTLRLTDHLFIQEPVKKTLTVHLLSPRPPEAAPQMHLWQALAEFFMDLEGSLEEPGGFGFTCENLLYTGMPYDFKFFWPLAPEAERWEHREAERRLTISDDQEIWTLEGDHELFDKPPVADREIILEVVDRPPSCGLAGPLELDVWVNRAQGGKLYEGLKPLEDGAWSFKTYPEIVTSFRFRSGAAAETVERHTLKVPDAQVSPTRRFVVLDRMDPLPARPVAELFQDPPFSIERPGVWEQDGALRFALHAPKASWVQIIGQMTGWRDEPLPMRSTRDGAYWWGQIPVSDLLQRLGQDDYHGALYKYLFNGIFERQDPAADWVENSAPESASRLVNHGRYAWESTAWQTPGWEYLMLYQLHPRRFSRRFAAAGLSPLRQVAREITDELGYLRQLGVTAIQLMPVNEFTGDHSWGYGPAFFYAVESSYCGDKAGPDDLKHLVDTCHKHGMAVLLDVVFNHAGTSDNVLWSIAPESFFDGDTTWGAMINFDHPQAIHFFEQNLRYLRREYRVDGFRLDHTHTIVHSAQPGYHVTVPGSGGGWEFLHKLRRALKDLDPGCLLIAEHLPNEWELTNYGGPMDSQWNDAFHDRLVEACRGWQVMPQLAAALKLSHTHCDDWYKVANYPESHDEVGNVNDRIVNVAGFGQGLRRNKVAAAITLLSRGLPMWFMGAEAGEWAQFTSFGQEALDLDRYVADDNCRRVRHWWRVLSDLRQGNSRLQGPSPLKVHCAKGHLLAFSRGAGEDYFAVLNFGPEAGWRPLTELDLPHWHYRELWNSTWPAFAVEGEDEHGNGGRNASLSRHDWLHIPDYGAVILERVG